MHQQPYASSEGRGRVLRESRANHQRGLESVGGHLTLTADALVFMPHTLNLQTEVAHFPLTAVSEVRKAWTKVFGVFPLVPNSMAVRFADGSEQSFVVPRRAEWIADLQRAARASRGWHAW